MTEPITVSEVKKPIMLSKGWYVLDLKKSEDRIGPIPIVLVDSTEMVLFGMGQKSEFSAIISQLRQIQPLETLQYLVVPSLSTHVISTMMALASEGAHPLLVVDEKVMRLLNLANQTWPYTSINESNSQLILKSGRILSFIRSPFLITPGSLMVYDAFGKTLFSNFLFSTTDPIPSEVAKTDYIGPIMSYCQNFVPSSDFLRPAVSRIAKLDIDRAITQSGVVFEREAVRSFCMRLSTFEFYNSNVYVTKNVDETREYHYQSLCNQVLHKLKSLYGTEEVLRAFQSTELTLNPQNCELMNPEHEGEKLWNRFFDGLYAQKGMAWISVVEPLVQKLIDLLGIAKPQIYQSKLLEKEKNIEKLDTEKTALVDRLVNVESHLKETMQRLIRDPKTHYYNEMFLREHLSEEILALPSPIPSATEMVLFYFQIDNILAINQKFSAKNGDETIRNLGYLLEQNANPDDLVVKRNGPGYILLVECLAGREIASFVQKIQNAAKESETFIEPITLSVAIVRLSEFIKTEALDEIADKMMITGENRIRANTAGTGRVIDEKTAIVKGKNGRILIADQEEINLRLLESLFFNENYDVTTAKDGLEAFRFCEEIAFDAILIDRTIAKMDGMLLKQKINTSPLNNHAFYILLTYNKNPEIIARANLLEIDLVVQKPVFFEEIAGIIARSLKKGGR